VLELEDRDVVPNLAMRLSALVRRHRVPGCQIAVYHAGDTESIEAGELRHRSGQRVTRDAAFPIGSITKTFTATLAMMLVADGDLELDAPLGDYLSELGELGAGMTLRQVLSHTAGLASGPDSDDIATTTPARYVREQVRGHNFVLPPGVSFSYSNMGYVLTGRLIETITGMSWGEAMSSILLNPLRIDPRYIAGGYSPCSARPLATGHSVNATVGRTRPVQQSLADVEAPAGALAVSAGDLVALGRLHVDGGVPALLPAHHARQMRVAIPAADPFGLADGWGLGLAVYRASATGGGEWYGHDGNADGTSCYLRIDPERGWVVALTSNANSGGALWRDLLVELAAAGMPIEPPRVCAGQELPVPPPAGCAGSYFNGELEYLVLARKDGLYLAVDDAAPTRLTCHQDLSFSVRDPASGERVFGGRFLRDGPTGRIGALQVGGRLGRRQTRVTHRGRRELTA
jgi:CubicO group peptidase (beta-lactamase class C family)